MRRPRLIRYFPTAGDTLGWAIDEDLRLLRGALDGAAQETSLAKADVVHAAYWPHLFFHHPRLLENRFVIAHADNPPFFYLTQPSFSRAQNLVDLWVARSSEASGQFRALHLPCVHIPYAVDTALFHPIADRSALRRKHGIPEDAYVIANFHRDSEGADVSRPKLQKAPEMMAAILRKVRDAGGKPHVLLAGPRRHWLRAELERDEIPFTFIGRPGIEGDDYNANVLSRPQLNELYNACDLYLFPSRWEGGPQSAMEAAAARTKVLSTPLGVARDILDPQCLFDTAGEAAAKILRDMKDDHLSRHVGNQEERVRRDHTAEAMTRHLRTLYQELLAMSSYGAKAARSRPSFADTLRETRWRIGRRLHRSRPPSSIRLVAGSDLDGSLTESVECLRSVMAELGIVIADSSTGPLVAAGSSAPTADFRLLPAGGAVKEVSEATCHVAMAVQDAVNFRHSHPSCPVLVCPLVAMKEQVGSESATVVESGDLNASRRIWKAMRAKSVPIYPDDSAYYYQVFHGGIGYGQCRTREEALRLADEEKDTFVAMARPPSSESAVAFWRQLLATC